MMSEQKIVVLSDDYKELKEYLTGNVMLVCDNSLQYFKVADYLKDVKVKFDDIKPNPPYETVVEGVKLFHANECDKIIAVGGGSAMDVAKCIKLYSNMDDSVNYLKQTIVPNDTKLYAIPTTAGTGSEATRYAVIYFEGEKQSVTDYSCIPSVVFMDTSVLETLPEYQKKSTMLDALCHATESFWSVNSTEESRTYAKEAISTIIKNKDAYLSNDSGCYADMLKASNLAGKAINITQTTAGHAMCYKLTSLYGISHGHAAAFCDAVLWPYMIENTDKCIDPRGPEHLNKIWDELAEAYGCQSPKEAVEKFIGFVKSLDLKVPVPNAGDYDILKTSVNPVRLKNNPVGLDEETVDMLYHQIME